MDPNQSQPSSLHLGPYPSISLLSALLSHSAATTPQSAKTLLNICRNVERDLDYVTRLQEEVQLTLNTYPAYHADWIDEVRRAASEALHLVNKHIESKMPGTQPLSLLKGSASELQTKIANVVTPSKKDTEGINNLRADLSLAHASLMGVAGFMQQIALRQGDLTLDRTQLHRFRTLSSGSEGQDTSQSVAVVTPRETSTPG